MPVVLQQMRRRMQLPPILLLPFGRLRARYFWCRATAFNQFCFSSSHAADVLADPTSKWRSLSKQFASDGFISPVIRRLLALRCDQFQQNCNLLATKCHAIIAAYCHAWRRSESWWLALTGESFQAGPHYKRMTVWSPRLSWSRGFL